MGEIAYTAGPGTPRVPAEPGCEALCSRARISWTLPVPLLPFAGALAVLPLASLVRWPTSAPRLVAEAFLTALVVIVLVWLAWVVRWLLKHRW